MGAACAAAALALSGCSTDPAAPLIPTPAMSATVLPSEARPVDDDGYPNILADPATVAGLPRSAGAIAAEEATLEAEGAATEAETRGLTQGSFAGNLARQGRNHVAETRRQIEASGRPALVSPPPLTPAAAQPQPAQPAPAVDPGRPIDPDAPLPRAVGVPPFSGNPVATDENEP
ncbi:MAG: hypothetical protein ROR55_19475 [Devosia sp.]